MCMFKYKDSHTIKYADMLICIMKAGFLKNSRSVRTLNLTLFPAITLPKNIHSYIVFPFYPQPSSLHCYFVLSLLYSLLQTYIVFFFHYTLPCIKFNPFTPSNTSISVQNPFVDPLLHHFHTNIPRNETRTLRKTF